MFLTEAACELVYSNLGLRYILPKKTESVEGRESSWGKSWEFNFELGRKREGRRESEDETAGAVAG